MAAAPKHGKVGAFYAATGIIRARTLAFAISPSRITDSGSGFVTAGFVQGQKIEVVGSASNDTSGTPRTIATGGVAAGSLTLTSAPAPEDAGPTVLVYQAAPGGAPYGFTNWAFDYINDVKQTTNFQDANSGWHAFLGGISGWTGTAERNFSITDDTWPQTNNPWVGGVVSTWQWVRFFVQYAAIPTAPIPAIFYEGLALVTASNITYPHDDIVTQKYDIQGVGALTPVTKTSAW